MIIHYEAAPLPGRCYCSRVRWVPELNDHIMITLFDPERLQPYLTDSALHDMPGAMCEAVQNIPTVPPAPKLRLVS